MRDKRQYYRNSDERERESSVVAGGTQEGYLEKEAFE